MLVNVENWMLFVVVLCEDLNFIGMYVGCDIS